MRENEVVGGMSCDHEEGKRKSARRVSSSLTLDRNQNKTSKTHPLQSSIQRSSVPELLQEPIVNPELLLLARSRSVVDPDLSLLSDQRSLLLVLGSIGLCASEESSEIGTSGEEGSVGGGVERSGIEGVGGGRNGGDFGRSSLTDGEGGIGETGGEMGVVGLLGQNEWW